MPTIRHYAHFTGAGALEVDIDTPADGATVTTVAPTIVWTFTGGATQSGRRIAIFSDAAASVLVYDSGWVSTAAQSAALAGGLLESGRTYYLRVAVIDTLGAQGESALTRFLTAFATSVDITNLRLATIGACGTPQDVLPRITLTWRQIVPGAGETFVKYQIRRRVDGGAWEAIGEITAVGTVTFTDYTPAGWTPYQYAVVWYAAFGASSILVSAVHASVAMLTYDFAWLHSTSDPTKAVRLESYEWSIDIVDSVSVDAIWGQKLPVTRVGGQLYRRVSVTLAERLARDARAAALAALQQHQVDTGATLCFRHGRSRERMFCAVSSVKGRLGQKTRSASMMLVEAQHEESVA